MKRSLSMFLAILVIAAAAVAADEGRFFTYPTIHSDTIVFTYESDLWSVDAKGGVAARLTTFPGTESFAKLSPDGKWLAFTATYDGAPAVYLMPSEGGAPVRLTYNPGGAQVVAWTPDGSEIVFRSSFENVVGRDPNLFSVGVKGGAPVRLPLDRGVLVSFIPEKHQFLFCRRGNEEYYWKRYKGGQYQDIWLYDAVAKTYAPVTDYVGKNSYPMWAGGLMYFVSDRGNGISNLYTQKLGTKDVAPVTKYDDFDVMMPHTDGRSIVYVQDGRIHVLDVASGADTRISVKVPSDRWALRDRVINPKDYIQTAGVGRRRPGRRPGGARRRLPRPHRPRPGREPVRDAGHARDVPGPLAGREDRRVLQRQERRLPALHPARGRRRLDADHDRARPDRLQAPLVARRPEDPLRQQGLRDLLGRPRDEEAGQGRFLQPDEERRVHLGDRRLRLVARLPVDRLQLRPGQPQQPDLPLRHRDREEGRRHDRLLRQPLPGLRRERRLPLLRLEPELRPAHGLLRGQPRHRDAPAGHGRPAPGRRGPALRRRARREGRQEGRPRALPDRRGGPGQEDVPAARPRRQLFPPQGREGQGPLARGRRVHRGRIRGHLQAHGRDQVVAPRLRHGRPQGHGPRRQGPRLLPVARRRHAPRPPRRRLLHDRRRQGLRLQVGGGQARPLRPRLQGRPPEGVAPDLQRRLALVPRLLLRRRLPRPRLEGHGRQVPGLHPRAVLAGRAQLGPVPDGRRAVRLAHLRRRRRLRPGRDARLARLHRAPRRRPRRRQGLGPLQAGQDLRPDRRQPQPGRAARPAGHRREGRGLTSWPSAARRSRPATTTSSSSRRRPGRRSRSRSTRRRR